MSIAWLIFITVIFFFLQGVIYVRWGLAKIDYHRTFSQATAYVGEEIELIDEIANKKLLPVPWVRLESKINKNLQFGQVEGTSRGEMHRTLFSLMPYQKIKRRQKVLCTKRGYYQFETVSMSTGDAIGFDEAFKTVHSSAAVTVFPKIREKEDIPLPAQSWVGEIMVKRWIIEDPFLVAGVREYSTSDPMHTINWKATARTGKMQVNQYDYTADLCLMIYVNFDQTEDKWRPIVNEDTIERALSYAASIAHYSIDQGIATGFGCNSYLVTNRDKKESIRITPGNGHSHLTFMLDHMAKAHTDISSLFYEFLEEDVTRQREKTDFLIITNVITEKVKHHITILEKQGHSVETLLLEDDRGAGDVYAS
ncbi:DUF58 domain-containing protein [Bacillus sp. JCM 19034]|uniref:DUF58 domain-containing protein n=1 Tax=Bacillus sp. JCM 19034 TaxID=1481928 RepID=UPI00078300CA|nr:DUF58 domain-containing protein [Bacillus sp. JCM 19034]